MPTDKPRVFLTIRDEQVLHALGLTAEEAGAGALWAALVRYANHLQTAGVADRLDRQEWCLLADVLNGAMLLDDLADHPIGAVTLLTAEVEDGHRLNGLGAKWFGLEAADARTAALLAKLRGLTALEAEAVLVAVRRFWQHPDTPADAEWWRPEVVLTAAPGPG